MIQITNEETTNIIISKSKKCVCVCEIISEIRFYVRVIFEL